MAASVSDTRIYAQFLAEFKVYCTQGCYCLCQEGKQTIRGLFPQVLLSCHQVVLRWNGMFWYAVHHTSTPARPCKVTKSFASMFMTCEGLTGMDVWCSGADCCQVYTCAHLTLWSLCIKCARAVHGYSCSSPSSQTCTDYHDFTLLQDGMHDVKSC